MAMVTMTMMMDGEGGEGNNNDKTNGTQFASFRRIIKLTSTKLHT